MLKIYSILLRDNQLCTTQFSILLSKKISLSFLNILFLFLFLVHFNFLFHNINSFYFYIFK